MSNRVTAAPASYQPPAPDAAAAFLLVPTFVRNRATGRERLLLAAITAPSAYGWGDAEAWRERKLRREAASVFEGPPSASLCRVTLGACERALEATRGASEAGSPAPSADDDVPMTGYWAAGEDGGALELYVTDLPAVRSLLQHAARRGQAVELRVQPESGGGSLPGARAVTAILAHRPYRSRTVAPERLRDRLRREHQAAALRIAQRQTHDLPPLLKPEDWKRSPVHQAAREIVLGLGEAAFRGGWSVRRLEQRVSDALEFLLQARAGGLGNHHFLDGAGDRDGDEGPLTARDRSVLVPAKLPETLVAKGSDPLRDDRARVAYEVAIQPRLAGALIGDVRAHSRLHDIPGLVEEYLEKRWLRYGPLTAALARALVVKEMVLFFDEMLRRPAGVLDGSLDGLGAESVACRLSSRGRRPLVLGLVRFAQFSAVRLLTTALLLVSLLAIEVPYAGWIAAAWLFFGRRIRALLFGPPELSALEKSAQLYDAMQRAYGALGGDAIPVAVYRHALLTASEKGVAWDAQKWSLLADAERRGDDVWSVRPGPAF